MQPPTTPKQEQNRDCVELEKPLSPVYSTPCVTA